jgi:hypothetical protein
MHPVFRVALFAVVGAATFGCSSKPFDGPTVDAFKGKLTHDGKAVSFPEGEKVELKVFHEKGQSFGIPINTDGSFDIGWMPIGKYSAMLNRGPKGSRAPPMRYNVPGGLSIKEGQTEYTIELGKGWTP